MTSKLGKSYDYDNDKKTCQFLFCEVTMRKEEILEKGRAENRDEREDAIRDQSVRWTFMTMVLLSAVFAYLRAAQGQTMMDLTVVVCGSVSVSFLYRFFRTKRKELLLLGLVVLACAAIALVRYCTGN